MSPLGYATDLANSTSSSNNRIIVDSIDCLSYTLLPRVAMMMMNLNELIYAFDIPAGSRSGHTTR